MKTIFIAALISLSSAHAFSKTFTCGLKESSAIEIRGTVSNKETSLKIKDDQDTLGIRDLDPQTIHKLDRSLRKKETSYSFAKYYGELNAWQDLEFSVPKDLSAKTFAAYLTTYIDDGDRMVPAETHTLRCVVGN